MELRRVGDGPIGDDVTTGTIPASRDGLMRRRVGSPLTVAGVARFRHRVVQEVSLYPIGKAPMAAGALRLEDLGMKEGLLSRLVLVTRQARRRKRSVDRGRHRGDPLMFRVAVLTGRREAVVGWSGGLAIRFVAAHALRLPYHPGLVGRATDLRAPHHRQLKENPSDRHYPHGSHGKQSI